MTFSFRPAKRENVSLLIGLAGGTGAGKTFSAMRLAKGLAGDRPFAVIDTEAGRAKHYADDFRFDHGDLTPPFRPDKYAEAIAAADTAGYPVILVDSFSHEHAGDGGLLDWHEEEYKRLGGREAVKMTAWIAPKMAHRKMVSQLLQVRAHLILCFRAETKVEIAKDEKGKTVVRPKQTLTGLDGWVPIAEKNLPFELTASFLLLADRPGVPHPIKLEQRHRAFFPSDEPISEESGRSLGVWAAGGSLAEPEVAPLPGSPSGSSNEPTPNPLLVKLLGLADEYASLMPGFNAGHVRELAASKDDAWLQRQITSFYANIEARRAALTEPEDETGLSGGPDPATTPLPALEAGRPSGSVSAGEGALSFQEMADAAIAGRGSS